MNFGNIAEWATAVGSFLALLAAIRAIRLQSQELAMQRQELAAQRVELARTAEIQSEMAKVSRTYGFFAAQLELQKFGFERPHLRPESQFSEQQRYTALWFSLFTAGYQAGHLPDEAVTDIALSTFREEDARLWWEQVRETWIHPGNDRELSNFTRAADAGYEQALESIRSDQAG